jgi:hypothetical protein
MPDGGVYPAAAAYGKQVRGGHFSKGHSHQISIVKGGNLSTAIVGVNSNSAFMQLQYWGRMSGTVVVPVTNASCADLTSNVTSVTAGKVVHTGKNYTNYLLLASWDQPDA